MMVDVRKITGISRYNENWCEFRVRNGEQLCFLHGGYADFALC